MIYGVQLDLAAPERIAPANDQLVERFVMMPAGSSIQVTGEENHREHLGELVARVGGGPSGQAVYATLHEIAKQTSRGPGRPLVEVRIDGARAGELSPRMSDAMLPVIRHAADAGMVVACQAVLKGNRIDQQVTLYPARANELDEEFLAGIGSAA